MNEFSKEIEFYAHSENDAGKIHYLKVHLFETAKTAKSFSLDETDRKILKVAGLLHDLGKYQPDFQRYLIEGGKRGSVPHAAMGAGYARKLKQLEISFAIDGHHKGLPDRSKWQKDTAEFNTIDNSSFLKLIKSFFHDTCLSEKDFEIEIPVFNTSLERELFMRYIFSVLTDADWLDTEKHFDPRQTENRIHTELEIDLLQKKLVKEIAGKPKNGVINELRNKIREEVLGNSNDPVGFYSLNIPTGMGKTLLSVDWALCHAKTNGQKRIIIVLPYINIIDQTAKQLKEIFGEEWILEHHSGYNEESKPDEDTIDKTEKCKQLACENWDYPIIVTTTVQFFESLFSNHKSRCRKLHNIARSVVVFDEVQSIPKDIILPTLTMLKNIQKIMKTSFLFCTATMPAFEKRERFEGIEYIHPLVKNPSSLFQSTKRVQYEFCRNLVPTSLELLVEGLKEIVSSILCIFNTKKAVKECFKSISNGNKTWEKIYHLSTGMCAKHRKETIANIRKDLENKLKIFVASTQLIEAGVDFDFPCVFREIAPLESIIQSAGRCNREGAMPALGKFFLFRLENSSMPDKAYKTYAEYAIDLIKDDKEFLNNSESYGDYYKKVIALFTDPDKFKINNLREKFEFETVNSAYKLIKNPTISVFVFNYNQESRDIFKIIQYKPVLSRKDHRDMQVYSVQVYKNFLFKNTHLYEEDPKGFMVWYGGYDSKTGISTELLPPDACIL